MDATEEDRAWTPEDLRRGDFVLLYNGLADGQVNVGKVAYVGKEHFLGRVEDVKWDDDMNPDKSKVRIRWMYRPHDIAPELLPTNVDMADNELLFSNHVDTNPVSTVIGKCHVCPYKQIKERYETVKALYFWRLSFDAKRGTVKVDRDALGYDGKEFQWATRSSKAKGRKTTPRKRKRVRKETGKGLQESVPAGRNESRPIEISPPSEAGGSRIDNDRPDQHMATSEKQEETFVDLPILAEEHPSVKSGGRVSARAEKRTEEDEHEQADSLRVSTKKAGPEPGDAGSPVKRRKSKRIDQPPLSVSDVPVGSGLDILTEAAAREEDSEKERELEFSEWPSSSVQPQGVVLGVSDLTKFAMAPVHQHRPVLSDVKSSYEDQGLAVRLLEKLPSLWLQGLIDSNSMSKLKMLVQHCPQQLRPVFHVLSLQGYKDLPDSYFASVLLGCLQKAAADATKVATLPVGCTRNKAHPSPSPLQLEATWGDKFLVSAWIGGSMYRGTLQLTQPGMGASLVSPPSALQDPRTLLPIPDINAPPPGAF